LELTTKLSTETKIDGILLASGLDDEYNTLESLHDLAPINGNPPQVFRRVRDRYTFFNELKRIDIPFPETHIISEIKEGIIAAKDMGYPVILKPLTGYGGHGVMKIKDSYELQSSLKKKSNEVWLLQEYVPGIPASISFMANGSKSTILTLNEQLLGRKEFGQMKEFTYCGNIVPLYSSKNFMNECEELTNRITSHFTLRGSNGIDIILPEDNDKIKIIEVNPRFQGSLECIEKYLNINLVEKHIQACNYSELPKRIHYHQSKYCIRAILFTKTNSTAPDLISYKFIRDIPQPGSYIPIGDPLCSLIFCSSERNHVYFSTRRYAEMIYELVRDNYSN
jgi:predicted ATP-grasp superfamily ATP-dependent carboligase